MVIENRELDDLEDSAAKKQTRTKLLCVWVHKTTKGKDYSHLKIIFPLSSVVCFVVSQEGFRC